MYIKSYTIRKKIEFTVYPIFLHLELGDNLNEYFTLDKFYDLFVLSPKFCGVSEIVIEGNFNEKNIRNLEWIMPRLLTVGKTFILILTKEESGVIARLPYSRIILAGEIKFLLQFSKNLVKTDIILIKDGRNNKKEILQLLRSLPEENSPLIYIDRDNVDTEFLKQGRRVFPSIKSDPLCEIFLDA